MPSNLTLRKKYLNLNYTFDYSKRQTHVYITCVWCKGKHVSMDWRPEIDLLAGVTSNMAATFPQGCILAVGDVAEPHLEAGSLSSWSSSRSTKRNKLA